MGKLPNVTFPTLVFFGVILLALGHRAFFWEPNIPLPNVDQKACTGEPIAVDYPYKGSIEDPHSCAVQCRTGTPSFILYSNGLATQCEPPPGCLDWGEDHGILCTLSEPMSLAT